MTSPPLLAEVDSADDTVSVRAAVDAHVEGLSLSQAERDDLRADLTGLFDLDYGADVDDIAANWADADDEHGGGDVTFPGGYSAVFAPLLSDLRVHLNSCVTSIRATGSGVVVTASTGVYEADAVILTVPPTVLASGAIEFDGVADDLLQAASRVPLGCLSKTAMLFDTPFWDPAPDWHHLKGADPLRWVTWFRPRHDAGHVLVGFNGGDPAREYEAADPADVQADAMRALRDMYGSGVPEPRAIQTTAWSLDPLVRGSYSYVAVGSNLHDRAALRRPLESRIYIAGEATATEHTGTVHGAWNSGLRAATEALRRD
ncbi:MAG: NAD(P)/FAD-dependent oxidoreductase [Mobilicoccus sp.]|nr:NAD(P)/FAD-dependent oxidoreductase [Mobilicoccus sp.]